ncbi:hypothetical protein [Streptomyces melanogenes]|uniref:Uncharacterized protein n=1 Tax=Streptomyces melanogenes TaxID=67326 RepID=A0ABZ1XUU0_9ACTN|nr:hypothetical protein [Streptomyces melanogenes]
MGYDIHITRGGHWWDDRAPEITTAQGAAAVEADTEPEMIPQPAGGNGPQHWAARVITHPPEDRLGTALRRDCGTVSAKNPTGMLLATMRQSALTLNARVQGDDGRYHDA